MTDDDDEGDGEYHSLALDVSRRKVGLPP